MFRRCYLSILFFLIILMTFPCVNSMGAEKTITLKLAHDLQTTHAFHISALKFAESVNKKSNGSIKIEVYPAAQLGDLRELMELTQVGTVDFNLNSAGITASFVPVVNLFGLPFLINDKAQAKALYEGPLAKRMLESAEQYRIKLLAFHTYTFRAPMNSKRPLKTIEDFKGLKMRLMQVPVHMDTYSALGCSPVAIPFSELYMAGKMGTVDGFENAISSIYSQKLHEVGKYYSTLPVFINTGVIAASLKTWNEKLDASQRKVILDCAPEFAATINSEYDRLEEESMKKVKEYGIQVYEGPFDLKAFRAAVKPVYDKWVPKLPESGQEIVKELQKEWR